MEMQSKIRIALLDDHTLFRKTIRDYLGSSNDMEVRIEASSLQQLFTELEYKPIDIVIMDFYMPDVNGLEALQVLRKTHTNIKIIFLSMCQDVSIVRRLLEEGIYAYLSKADEPEDLVTAIQSASKNKAYRNRLFTEALYWNSESNLIGNGGTNFDDREKRVLQLMWQEKNNQEIADELFLSIRTVEKIRQNMKSKLGVKSTIGLLRYAVENMLVN
jgi:DNA-binding NarL/FixJ family response regulator